MKIYLVGGAVRDKLLGKKPNDKDYVVVGSSVEEMISLGFESVGKDFPVFLHPETKEEYALARKEIKTGKGYTGFQVSWNGVTLEEDLYRRDLTINAIAQDIDSGEIFSPHGGVDDIHKKTLRHVSTHFSEDPLRVLRLARFLVQLPEFNISPETVDLCKSLSETDELEHLTGERIWKEMTKALCGEEPTRFFEFLRLVGALKKFFPELDRLHGVPQAEKYHPEGCAWTHAMLVLHNVCKMTDQLDVRFSALVHDLGKGITPSSILPSHHNHEKDGLPLVKEVCDRFKVPNSCRTLAMKVCEQHLRVHKCLQMKPGKLLTLMKNMEHHRNSGIFEGVMMCCRADDLGKESSSYPQAQMLTILREELNNLDISPVVQKYKGNGPKIGEQIEQTQIKLVKKVSKEFQKLHLQ